MFWIAPNAAQPGPEDDFWYEPVGSPTASGQRVTVATALSYPAVYACARVISEVVMQIPLILYQRTRKDGKRRATEHPLYGLMHDAPNTNQTSAEWRDVMQHHLLLRGNAYSEIEVAVSGFGGNDREVTSLGIPRHPDFVEAQKVITDGEIGYRYLFKAMPGEPERVLPARKVLHLRGLGVDSDGITGLSPIDMEREAVGVSLATQDFISRFFKNDARPGGYIEHPGNFKSDEQRSKWLASWQNAQTGANRHKTALLEYGLKYHPLDLKLVDAQFLENRKYQNIDIARIFRVPPHLIMELDRATFSNITQQDIEFVKFTLLPWIVRWEMRLSQSLLTDAEREQGFFLQFLVDGLERGDGEARSKYYKAGIQDGWLTRNEVRKLENMDPLDGLDDPLEPMNMRNPGGENDERMNALKQSSAEACARKQRHLLTNHCDREAFIRSDWRRVQEFMKCSSSGAQRVCEFVANLYPDDFEAKLDFDVWEARQVKLLVDMT